MKAIGLDLGHSFELSCQFLSVLYWPLFSGRPAPGSELSRVRQTVYVSGQLRRHSELEELYTTELVDDTVSQRSYQYH